MPWTLPAARRRPDTLGLRHGRLAACPNKPNCVSSQSDDPAHVVEPLSYEGPREAAIRRVRAILAADPRATIITEDADYLHAEYQATIFVDDVEFHFPADAPRVDIRSASRVGHSDLGANRRRVEAIRVAFSAKA